MNAGSESLVRDAFDALSQGDLSRLLQMVDADFEWTFLDPSEVDPRPQVCRGVDELARMIRNSAGQPARELIELSPYGERVLVVSQLATDDGPDDGAFPGRNFHVVTVRGGRITALRACRSKDEAIEVARRSMTPPA